jgi:hypothetical protein
VSAGPGRIDQQRGESRHPPVHRDGVKPHSYAAT